MARVILVVRGEVNISPTITNYLVALTKLGYEVHCICSSVKVPLENVKYHFAGMGVHNNVLKKLYGYWDFGVKAKKILVSLNISKSDIVWVSRIDTALCLNSFPKNVTSVLALHELHDSYPFWIKITGWVIKNYTKVVYNEANRAQIARVMYGLKALPTVIPNKPSEHPLKKKLPIKNSSLSDLVLQLNNKKVIIYQGSLQSDRSIEELVKATANLDSSYVLLIMGKDPEGKIPTFKAINPSLVYIPWVVPPDHLNITSHAYIGVAFYDTDCLNSIYCAPNKIWEYSGFGVPVLGQDIPGLIETIEKNGYGKCVDINDEHAILDAIKYIDKNYETLSLNASEFYRSVDFEKELQKLLGSVFDD
ncbi:glycosyltransferase [Pseudoalteromonas agarivorans]|uniref:Uncharacterized protein n=1 Tax=Pseudoalteromonas agarivorans DSM 14585 TaxID=1312369 RepID=A0ACA8DSZ4_9GAMM|nr:glycosyltransferase [Pseudoalteromonas agarivorans]ATC81066.1 hypothetical protein PAGA_a0515 [Pseudoalteromonas agarivorans DSM 14585]